MKIYIEGGGDGDLEDVRFLESWRKFFVKVGLDLKLLQVVRGQGRQTTFDRFLTALKRPRPDTLPLLLVDSEEPVRPGWSAWQHPKARDQWDRPEGARDDQAFLMVQVMETWFLGDREGLRRFFGASFRDQHIPKRPDLEAMYKRDVLDALERATRACSKPYAKGRTSFELLAQLDPGTIARQCPSADRLLRFLRSP